MIDSGSSGEGAWGEISPGIGLTCRRRENGRGVWRGPPENLGRVSERDSNGSDAGAKTMTR